MRLNSNVELSWGQSYSRTVLVISKAKTQDWTVFGTRSLSAKTVELS